MDAFDLDVRRHVYFSVVANGGPPTVSETARALARENDAVTAAYRRLHDAHALVLFPDTLDVWMANPFCFASTPHRVWAGGREWTATCAWDALGFTANGRASRLPTGAKRRPRRRAANRRTQPSAALAHPPRAPG